MIFMH